MRGSDEFTKVKAKLFTFVMCSNKQKMKDINWLKAYNYSDVKGRYVTVEMLAPFIAKLGTDFTIVEENSTKYIIITETLIEEIEALQFAYVYELTSSKYETDFNVDINILKDNYNKLIDDTHKLWDYMKTTGMFADELNFDVLLPKISNGEVWVKTEEGYRGFQVLELEERIRISLDNFDKLVVQVKREIEEQKEASIKALEDEVQRQTDAVIPHTVEQAKKDVIATKDNYIKELETKTTSSKEELTTHKKSLAEQLDKFIYQHKEDIHALSQKEIDAINETINKVEPLHQTLIEDVETAFSSDTTLKATISHATLENTSLSSVLSESKRINDSLHSENNTASSHIATLNDKNNLAETNTNKLRTQIDEAENVLTDLLKNIVIGRTVNEELKSTISDSIKKNDALTSTNTIADSTNTKLTANNQKADKANEDLVEHIDRINHITDEAEKIFTNTLRAEDRINAIINNDPTGGNAVAVGGYTGADIKGIIDYLSNPVTPEEVEKMFYESFDNIEFMSHDDVMNIINKYR